MNEQPLTWDDLVAIEPRLLDLLQRCREAGQGQVWYCYEQAWFGHGKDGLRSEVVRLVGFKAAKRHPVLCSQSAYELAYETLLQALPECRNCSLHNDDYDPEINEDA